MDAERATDLLLHLADRVNPYTGERFPADSPYQQADTNRRLGTENVWPGHGVVQDVAAQ
jgi:hypothetical protein